jgi:hypothetical protein
MLYYNKFDKFLIEMSNDLPQRKVPFPESIVHIYYDDYLYTNIKNIITFDRPVCLNKWSNTHKFVLSGINIRRKYYFNLFYPGTLKFHDENEEYEDDYPYFGKKRHIIENIITQDDGDQEAIEIVRKIAADTHVLIMPYFVHTTRFQYLRYVYKYQCGIPKK